MKNARIGASGVSLVSHRVQGQLQSDWQGIDAENDDAVDGLVFLRSGEKFSGRTLFVQVKSGESFKVEYKNKYPGAFGVKLGAEYIAQHRPRWDALPGPVILVYVEKPNITESQIYWQDLKADLSYSLTNKAVVLVPKNQTFGSEAKGKLRALVGAVPDNYPLKEIDLRPFRSVLSTPKFTLGVAKSYYRDWANSSDRIHPELGEIEVTNVGWRHITRQGRNADRILNSILLLESAKQMVLQGADWRQLGAAKRRERTNSIDIMDALSLRANILFRHRTAAPVQVILRRTRSICLRTGATSRRIKFLSVHELQRGSSRYYGAG
jgi:hypothetical protein